VVPVVDLSRRGQRVASEFGVAAQRIAANGIFLLGAETAAFEREFAHWIGMPDAVAVSSGAAALQLALVGLGVGPGDEVILPAFTAVPTASAVCAVGAVPVLVDVERATGLLDLGLIESARTDRTKAVIVVHLYGRPAELPHTDLLVIEDAAQAHGALVAPRSSDAVAYSFYPTKNLGGIGDGGVVAIDNEMLGAYLRRLRVHGMTEMYAHAHVSQNFRMSEVEAAWLRLLLSSLHDDNNRRRDIAGRYREAAPHLAWQQSHPDHVFHQCVFRSLRRDDVRTDLAAAGVATGVHYPFAVTQQVAYKQFARTACPQAEAWAAECISVPCFPELTDVEVDQVASELAKVAP